MTPGPIIIRKCSSCGKHISQRTLRSSNTFGARLWTDGKMDAPMLPEQLRLAKCQHCNTLVWIEELQQVGKIEPRSSDNPDLAKLRDAKPPDTPTLEEYTDYLDSGVTDKEKERFIRLQIWWGGNDLRREICKPFSLDSFEAQNLIALTVLLDETYENDRIMKAEAFRELREFDASEELLSMGFNEELMQAVSFIRDLNQKQISAVAEIRIE